MLPGISAAMVGAAAPPTRFLTAIQRAGLSSGLVACYDAGDVLSVASGSQTKWLDVAGSGYDLFRGADVTATTDDPTFNGTPGGLSASEYWSVDGGDQFRYDTSNETWMNTLHKDNAKFSFGCWAYLTSFGSALSLFGTNGNSAASVGVQFGISTSPGLSFTVANGLGSYHFNGNLAVLSGAQINKWVFYHIGVDLTAGTYRMGVNGGFGVAHVESGSLAGLNPASATRTLELGAGGNGSQKLPNASRIGAAAFWSGTSPFYSVDGSATFPQAKALYEGTYQRWL